MGDSIIVRAQLGRTRGKTDQLRAQLVDVLNEDHPQSVRHLFYRMTNPRLSAPVSKDDKGYRTVQYQLAKMRREGLIEYNWITDATRRGLHVNTFENAADFVRQMAGLYRANAWLDCEHYVEVWTESRSIAGIIEDDCDDLGVSLYPSGGFTSLTLAYEAARYINSQCAKFQREAQIIYIGDYDQSGVLIDRKIEQELRSHLGGDITLNFHRIGINEDQIKLYDLPTKPRKPGDKRSAHVKETVEAEAMPARILRDLLREKVESFMPAGALNVAKIAEKSERDFLEQMADELEVQHG